MISLVFALRVILFPLLISLLVLVFDILFILLLLLVLAHLLLLLLPLQELLQQQGLLVVQEISRLPLSGLVLILPLLILRVLG